MSREIKACRKTTIGKTHHAGIWLLLTAAALFAQNPAPGSDSSIQTIAPTAGMVYHVGDTLKVQWIVHNKETVGGGAIVRFSSDAGLTFGVIVTNTLKQTDTSIYKDSIGTFYWVILDSVNVYLDVYASTVSTQCIAEVDAPYDEIFAASPSKMFTILPRVTSVVKPPIPALARNNRAALVGPAFDVRGRIVSTTGRERGLASRADAVHIVKTANGATVARIDLR